MQEVGEGRGATCARTPGSRRLEVLSEAYVLHKTGLSNKPWKMGTCRAYERVRGVAWTHARGADPIPRLPWLHSRSSVHLGTQSSPQPHLVLHPQAQQAVEEAPHVAAALGVAWGRKDRSREGWWGEDV